MTTVSVKGSSKSCASTETYTFLKTFGEPEINWELSKQLEDKGEFSNFNFFISIKFTLLFISLHNNYASNYTNNLRHNNSSKITPIIS